MKSFLTLIFWLNTLSGFAQDSIYIQQHAIQIEQPDSLDERVYKMISPYQLIMVGEMHGSKEPAVFVSGLMELLTRHACHVQVGMEIPADLMKTYLANPTDSTIYQSDFFVHKQPDNRASSAWAGLISKISHNPLAEVYFFDINPGETADFDDRDSLMYFKIRSSIQLHPTWKTITLSGNIHNRIKSYEGKTTMGLFLNRYCDLYMTGKLLSLNHVYLTDHTDTLFLYSVNYENYLFLYPPDAKRNYNGIYFTRELK